MKAHQMECQDPWFSYIQRGVKPVEGRKGTPKHRSIKPGDLIHFHCGERSFQAKVLRIDSFPDLESYLAGVGLSNALPGVETMEEGKDIYLQWSTPKQIEEHGFLGIWIEVVA